MMQEMWVYQTMHHHLHLNCHHQLHLKSRTNQQSQLSRTHLAQVLQ